MFETIGCSEMFDADWYKSEYPDLFGLDDPLGHFIDYGGKEGRNPSPYFDVSFYLEENKDIDPDLINTLFHYLTLGKDEGRLPKRKPFDHELSKRFVENNSLKNSLIGNENQPLRDGIG